MRDEHTGKPLISPLDLSQSIFKAQTKEGHEFEFFLDGTTSGFPEGTVISNRALPLFYRLIALSRGNFTGEIGSPCLDLITNEQSQVVN